VNPVKASAADARTGKFGSVSSRGKKEEPSAIRIARTEV
jgi:hypothetical protein